MKTAGRENPNRWATVPRNRAPGAVGQNNSRSIVWAEKQEKFQPKEKCFFLTSTFIELIRRVNFIGKKCKMRQAQRELNKESLQLGVLRFGFLQDGNFGVGIFPQREEIFVGGECADAGGIGIRSLRRSRLQGVSASHS
jgi:hypothetical protein